MTGADRTSSGGSGPTADPYTTAGSRPEPLAWARRWHTLSAVEDLGERRRQGWERAADWPLTLLAVLYLVAYSFLVLAPGFEEPAAVAMTVAWVVFAVDYLVRLGLSRRRFDFFRTHLLDLMVIVLPLLRPLRLLKLFMVFTVLHRQIRMGFRGRVLTFVAGSTVLLAYAASLAVYDAERHGDQANITTFGDAVWWTLTTMSTVGYGDRFPTTVEGRLVAIGLMVAGIALLGVITGSIATWFVDRIDRVENAENRTQQQLDELTRELRELRGRLDPGSAPQLLDRFSGAEHRLDVYDDGDR